MIQASTRRPSQSGSRQPCFSPAERAEAGTSPSTCWVCRVTEKRSANHANNKIWVSVRPRAPRGVLKSHHLGWMVAVALSVLVCGCERETHDVSEAEPRRPTRR